MAQQVTCLVTIHGIGFQQPPLQDGTPGYADGLHERLYKYLGSTLSDDPGRSRRQPGQAGPIYVQSNWPPNSLSTEPGLARLGTWISGSRRAVDGSKAPLSDGTGEIAHIALVYSRLEDQTPHPGSALETLAKAAVSLGHYTTVSSLVRTGFLDVRAMLGHHAPAASSGSLQVRSRIEETLGAQVPSTAEVTSKQNGTAAQDQGGALSVLGTLENDVATYICRNDLRMRVQSFVHDAILRLCCRDDVAGVVVNAHSQGTVVSYDVLRTLPPFAAEQVRWFVTAGSPLRKYVSLFNWGNEVGCIHEIKRWSNFWDKLDPVADPLMPPAGWHQGMKLDVPPEEMGLFDAIDPVSGQITRVSIDDREVDNLANSSGGGLQAHNYWDNDLQVVQPLTEILRASVAASSGAGQAVGG